MMLNVSYSNRSKRFPKKADKVLVKRIIEKIEKLRENPIIHDTKTVEGSKSLFRIRVGDYRILYEVDYRNNLIGGMAQCIVYPKWLSASVPSYSDFWFSASYPLTQEPDLKIESLRLCTVSPIS